MINENVYGAKSTWLDTQYQYPTITPKAKKANFGGEGALLMTGVVKGKLSYTEPIDKSIGYCGIGTESALSHLTYVGMKNGTPSIISTQDRFVTNFCWCEKTLNNPPTLFGNYFQYDNIAIHAWGDYATTFNYNKVIEPLTVVCPQNQILLIWLQAYNADFSLSWEGGLKEYESTYHTTYPNVTCVYLRTFFGNKAQNITMYEYTAQGLKIPWQLSILDNYVCEDFNLDFYDYAEPQNVVFGVFNNTNLMYKNSYFAIVATTENAIEHIKIVDLNTTNYRVYIEYYSDFAEDVRKTVACFGLYFTDDLSTAQNGTLTLTDMYIGLLDDDGIGHGNYLKGTDTANAPQNTWDDMTESGYDYTKDVDKTKYQNGTQFNLNVETSAFNKFYALTKSDVTQLANELYSIANDVPSGVSVTEYNMKTFLTNNPIDCIISLKKFPVKNIPLIGTPNNIYLGAKQTDILGCEVLAKTFVYYFNFSAANDTSLYPVNGNTFLDYEPYTKCTIVVPFCGSTEIPCSYMYEYGGCTVALMIDFVTGACTAFIMVNGNTIETLHGNCAINLPVSGIQSATLDANVNSTVQNYNSTAISSAISVIGGGLSFIIGAASLNPMLMLGGAAAVATGAIKGELAEQKTTYELQHMQTPFKSVSAASGAIAQSGDLRCKLLISRPKISPDYDATVYANTIGFACLDNTTVDKLSGLTIGDINLNGIQATDIEKQLIKKAFESGVIL